jgi:hypothetical protein
LANKDDRRGGIETPAGLDSEGSDMKRLWVIVLLTVGAFLAGCGAGVVDTHQQRKLRYKHGLDLQARQIIDDFDYFWLAERPMELTEWHYRNTD